MKAVSERSSSVVSKKETSSSYRNFKGLVKLWPWLKQGKMQLILSVFMIPFAAALETLAPLAVQKTIDLGVIPKDRETIIYWATIYLGLMIGTYLCRVTQSIATATAVHRMILEMRQTLIRHVLRMPSKYHDSQLSGALATRATSDFDNLSESLNQGVLSSVIDVVSLAGCVIGMFILSPKLALITIILVPVVGFIVMWFSKKLNHSMMSARKKIAALNGFTQEAFAAMTAVKLLNASKQVSKRYRSLNREHRDAQMESVFYDAFMFATLDGIASITLGIVLFYVIQTMDISHGLTAGIMVGFVQYVQQIFEPLKQLGTKMAMLQGAFTSIERIFGILDRHDKISGDQQVAWTSAPQVNFKNVSFSYGKESGAVLSNVNFTIPSGSSLAIVGATGSGKSTLIKLLTKMYDGFDGSIDIDGKPLSSINPDQLRENIAIVPQDIVLFEGSITFNISLGLPNVSESQVKKAAQMTGADQFINHLTGGFDFHVREGGANLSHGQRQLIVFTRALVRNPKMIILDEATSSIDPKSEALIQSSLSKIIDQRTVIVIAHRLNTVERCKNVLVMSQGKVIEFGPREKLLEDKTGAFYKLLQHGLASPTNSK
ncbi:MAG: ABC transporter ATP-binding protein [Proteobacteria bacterium]|nr:ABC transporter ATP-binding protein [Pseudomonadota bacterium]